MKNLVAGTAGHIDHGKTELIRALTGVDTDRLKEEKERGITIDIGFADLALTDDIHIAFIDVPGHERFIKNMLAGAGGIDLVLLVVAADESIRPQTREHFAICRLLGIRRGLIALTKTDLADPELVDLVRLEIGEFTKGSFLADAPVIPVSSKTGAGIDDLKLALREVAAAALARGIDGVARLPVDRSFSIRGFGTVVTGTLQAGILRIGQDVEVLPGGTAARVRSLEVHNRSVEEARAGQRAAVNLHGVDVQQVSRGDVVGPPGVFRPTHLLDLEVELLPSAPAAVKNLGRVRFHHGTAEVMGRLKLLAGPELAPGASGYAQIRLERPVVALCQNRFILRRYSPPTTIGGGTVLDNDPPKHRGFPAAVCAHLDRMASGDLDAVLMEQVRSLPAGAATAERLRGLTGRKPQEIEKRLEPFARQGKIRRVPTRPASYLPPETVEEICESILDRLRLFHRENPLSLGLSKEEIRNRLFPSSPLEFFRHFLQELIDRKQIRVEKDFVSLAGHRVTLEPEAAGLEKSLEEEFRKGSFSPPSLEEVVTRIGANPSKAEKIFYLLLQSGKLVRVEGGLVFHRDSLDRLKEIVWEYRERSDRIDVGSFKELTGTTRKSAIPLLGHLDRLRITRREGNFRVILPKP